MSRDPWIVGSATTDATLFAVSEALRNDRAIQHVSRGARLDVLVPSRVAVGRPTGVMEAALRAVTSKIERER